MANALSMTTALIFPGQGAQKIGMGSELAAAYAEAREVFQAVDDALGQNLSKLIFSGEQSELDLTANTQPAIMATSLAVWAVLKKQGGASFSQFTYAAGHSLGEYSALATVECFSLADTAKLLRTRGNAMQSAVPVGVGTMAALLGADLEPALEICADAQQDQIVTVANDNSIGQIVISGHKEAVARAIAIAAERGIKKSIMLPVSAPFHCPLMAPAARVMEEALSNVVMHVPQLPIIANVTASVIADPQIIRTRLVEQVTGMVRWRPSVEFMVAKGVTQMLELGPGKTLAGLAKRIAPDVVVHSIATPADVESYLNAQERKAS